MKSRNHFIELKVNINQNKIYSTSFHCSYLGLIFSPLLIKVGNWYVDCVVFGNLILRASVFFREKNKKEYVFKTTIKKECIFNAY